MTTQSPAADSVSLSDAGLIERLASAKDKLTGDDRSAVWRAIELLRKRELDAGGGKVEGWPECLMIRDTKIHDDMGGLGQRIFTTAGAGYEKIKYVRADLAQPTTPPAVEGDALALRLTEYLGSIYVDGKLALDPFDARDIDALIEAITGATPPGEAVIGDTHEERAHMQTIDERDHAYEIIDDILDLVLGSDRPEWSSAYDFTDAVHDVAEHVEALTKQAAQVGVNLATCDWPAKPFSVKDEPGEHDPCYLVMPDGSMVAFNHHAENGVDQARAQFVAIACNEALAKREGGGKCCANAGTYACKCNSFQAPTPAVEVTDER